MMPQPSVSVWRQEARWATEMVNEEKRLRAKDLVERFMACEITNDEFNDSFPFDDSDPALKEIYCNIWPFYCDTHTHKLDGKHRLSPEAKRLFTRCAAFLGSNFEYEWPPHKWIDLTRPFVRLFGRGKKIDEQFERFKAHGDFEVWPFIRKEDYAKLSEKSM
jgi:hypothetical protein